MTYLIVFYIYFDLRYFHQILVSNLKLYIYPDCEPNCELGFSLMVEYNNPLLILYAKELNGLGIVRVSLDQNCHVIRVGE